MKLALIECTRRRDDDGKESTSYRWIGESYWPVQIWRTFSRGNGLGVDLSLIETTEKEIISRLPWPMRRVSRGVLASTYARCDGWRYLTWAFYRSVELARACRFRLKDWLFTSFWKSGHLDIEALIRSDAAKMSNPSWFKILPFVRIKKQGKPLVRRPERILKE